MKILNKIVWCLLLVLYSGCHRTESDEVNSIVAYKGRTVGELLAHTHSLYGCYAYCEAEIDWVRGTLRQYSFVYYDSVGLEAKKIWVKVYSERRHYVAAVMTEAQRKIVPEYAYPLWLMKKEEIDDVGVEKYTIRELTHDNLDSKELEYQIMREQIEEDRQRDSVNRKGRNYKKEGGKVW